MNEKLTKIFRSCVTITKLDKELKDTKFYKFRKEKKQLQELKEEVSKEIDTLINEDWTSGYINDLIDTLVAFKDDLGFAVENDDNEYYRTNNFYVMKELNNTYSLIVYDSDKGNMIMIGLISDSINVDIMDSLGRHIDMSSTGRMIQGKNKDDIETVCKKTLIKSLKKIIGMYDK